MPLLANTWTWDLEKKLYHIIGQENLPLRGGVLHFLWCERNQLSLANHSIWGTGSPHQATCESHVLDISKIRTNWSLQKWFLSSGKIITLIACIRSHDTISKCEFAVDPMEVFKTELHATCIPFAFLHFPELSPTPMKSTWMAFYMLGNTCFVEKIYQCCLDSC